MGLPIHFPRESAATRQTPIVQLIAWWILAAVSLMASIGITLLSMLKARPVNGLEFASASESSAILASIFVIAISNLPLRCGERLVCDVEAFVVRWVPRLNIGIGIRLVVRMAGGLFTFVFVLAVRSYVASQFTSNPVLDQIESTIDEEIGRVEIETCRELSWATSRLHALRRSLTSEDGPTAGEQLKMIQEYITAVTALSSGDTGPAMALSQPTRELLPEARLIRWFAAMGTQFLPDQDLVQIIEFAESHPSDSISAECSVHARILLLAFSEEFDQESGFDQFSQIIEDLRKRPGTALLLANALAGRAIRLRESGNLELATADLIGACKSSRSAQQFSILRPRSTFLLTLAVSELIATNGVPPEMSEKIDDQLCFALHDTFNEFRYRPMSHPGDFDALLISIVQHNAASDDELQIRKHEQLLTHMHSIASVLFQYQSISQETLDNVTVLAAMARFARLAQDISAGRLTRSELLEVESANEQLRVAVSSPGHDENVTSRLNALFAGTCLSLITSRIYSGRADLQDLKPLMTDCRNALDRIRIVPDSVRNCLIQMSELAIIYARIAPPEIETELKFAELSKHSQAILKNED